MVIHETVKTSHSNQRSQPHKSGRITNVIKIILWNHRYPYKVVRQSIQWWLSYFNVVGMTENAISLDNNNNNKKNHMLYVEEGMKI